MNKRAKKKSNKGKIAALVVLAIVVCGLAVCAVPAFKTSNEDFTVRIPAGATYKNITDTLQKYADKDFASAVVKGMKMLRTDPARRHGAYEIKKGTNALTAARILSRGAQTPVKITVNGFRDISVMSDRISRKFDFSREQLDAVLANDSVFAPYGLSSASALALFVDDTYLLYWSATPEELVEKIGENYRNIWNKERTDKAAALGLTPEQVMVVCSIVDEETNKADEKGAIGRLYINRLDIGMKLQADPTVRYAVGDFTIRRVKGEHLRCDSPYNTYLHKGLPPGPIRTTSVATIDAVLNSAPSDYIYMCASPDFSGYHRFASTYEEHKRNAAEYQRALDAKGIN